MTADEFLHALALRAKVVHLVPVDLDESEDANEVIEPTLAVALDSVDADRFLALTGVRVE